MRDWKYADQSCLSKPNHKSSSDASMAWRNIFINFDTGLLVLNRFFFWVLFIKIEKLGITIHKSNWIFALNKTIYKLAIS
jgi:hypothetical protein